MAESSIHKIHHHAAGIDIGSERIFIAVEGQPVKSFATFTESYQEAIVYLQSMNISTVAMEATGVYWFALYEMLEAANIETCVVNATYVKHLPGRKSDVVDSQWLQELHAHGLLRRCFVPDDQIRQLRSYMRLRRDHIEMAAQHVQHMHKALEQMNIKLHVVLSQVQGVSGIHMLKAIVEGERDPEQLLAMCHHSIQRTKPHEVRAALRGNYRTEHLFALRQAIEAWEFYQRQIASCDQEMDRLVTAMANDKPEPPHASAAKPSRHRQPDIEHLHDKLMRLTNGRNPAAMTGLTDATMLEVISEVGTDMSHWKTAKHFTAWLTLAPPLHRSGKRRSKRRRETFNARAGQIFRRAAESIPQSKHVALGGFYRRLKARRGPMVAMKAVARKLAVMYFNIMTKGIDYVEQGLEAYNKNYIIQRQHYLEREARRLGLCLVSPPVRH